MKTPNAIIKIDKKISIDKIEVEVYKFHLFAINDEYKLNSDVLDIYPGVYCFYNEKEIYVGESGHPFTRIKQHRNNKKIKPKDEIIIFRSQQFHKSAVYDIETQLIGLLNGEKKYLVSNEKLNQNNHQYLFKESYIPVLNEIWSYLMEKGVVKYEIPKLLSLSIYKFSPYKSLTVAQANITKEILDITNELNDINNDETNVFLVNGYPGTGKSIIASYLYAISSQVRNTVLISGTHPTVNIFKQVFKQHNKTIKTKSSILNSRELISNKENYDLVIVDETHRLLRKGGKGMPMKFNHLKKGENELDIILNRFKNVVLLLDQNQNVHDGDVNTNNIRKNYSVRAYMLNEQIRANDGYSYISNIINFLKGREVKYEKNEKYLLKSYHHFPKLYKDLKMKTKQFPLSMLLSGYTREWISKKDNSKYDFNIDGIKLKWNKSANRWIESKAARNLSEVAYYHTIQGFDLEYAGVIVGKDIYMNDRGQIQVNDKYVVAINDRPHKNDKNYYEKLKQLVINRYIVLLTRGAKGTFIYFEDTALKNAFEKAFRL